MLPATDLAKTTPRAQLADLLFQAMGQDVEGQRGLIAARAQGRTDDAYWCNDGGFSQRQELRRRFFEETQQVIHSVRVTTVSIRRQIDRSRALLDRCRSDAASLTAMDRRDAAGPLHG